MIKLKTLKQFWDEAYREKYIQLKIADKDDDVELDFEPTEKAVNQWLNQLINNDPLLISQYGENIMIDRLKKGLK